MKKVSEGFTLQIDGVKGVSPAGEAWAEEQIRQKKIPVLACERLCIRGDIARRAANFVAQEKIIHTDALSLYHKYTDVFHM